jgi:hypothetical protein
MEEKKKRGRKPIDWDSPENRYKKQNAFKLFVADRELSEVTEALGIKNISNTKRFIYSEKWEKHKQIWLDNPDKEMPYPWEEEAPVKLAAPPPDMSLMKQDKRIQCIKGFSMYCAGRNIAEIAQELNASHATVSMWADTQRWKICRERLVNDQSPAPWESDDVPTLISDITASLETMKKSIKFLTGKVLVKAADAAQELDGMEALGMMRNIKQLAEAATINFSEPNQQSQVQINIATKLESLKVPDNNTFEAELVVNE